MASIDKREWKNCGECNWRMIVPGTDGYNWYVCDCCGKEMNPNEPHNERTLEVTVFRQNDPDFPKNDRQHYCSWACLTKHLPTVDCDYFMGLPNLMYDERTQDGQGPESLFRLLAAGLEALEAKE